MGRIKGLDGTTLLLESHAHTWMYIHAYRRTHTQTLSHISAHTITHTHTHIDIHRLLHSHPHTHILTDTQLTWSLQKQFPIWRRVVFALRSGLSQALLVLAEMAKHYQFVKLPGFLIINPPHCQGAGEKCFCVWEKTLR